MLIGPPSLTGQGAHWPLLLVLPPSHVYASTCSTEAGHSFIVWFSGVQRPVVTIFTVGHSYASAVLGVVIPSVRLSVCLSVTHVLCDKTKQCTADILIPHDRAITLVFWHQQWLVVDGPSVWNLHSKWLTPQSCVTRQQVKPTATSTSQYTPALPVIRLLYWSMHCAVSAIAELLVRIHTV